MLKDLYSKKTVIIKSPKKVKETDEDEDEAETKKKVLRMVENEK